MASELMDWDSAYRNEGDFLGPPPWNIGEPQPELAEVIRSADIRDDVLDAGCGHAELALAVAAQGHVVVGIDVSPTAVAAATSAAAERGLNNATFVCDDITSFGGYDGRFATIFDSTLFHSLPVEARAGYLASIRRAAAPGARYYALVFAHGAFPDEPADMPNRPHAVTEEELRAAVSRYFVVDEVRPAWIHADVPAGTPMAGMVHQRDDAGRAMMPAYLLAAHKED